MKTDGQRRGSYPQSDSFKDSLIARTGLILTGAFLLFPAGAISGVGTGPPADRSLAIASLLLYLLAFGLLVCAVVPRLIKHVDILILAAVLLGMLGFYYSIFAKSPRFYLADTLAFTHSAAEMVVRGENPYQVKDRAATQESANDAGFVVAATITRQPDGEVVDRLFVYPAGHLLPYAAAVALGLNDMRWLSAAATIAAIVLLWWQAPMVLRPLAAFPVAISVDHSYLHTIGGVTDPLWLLPVMCTAIALRSERYNLAAIAFGWATATKQQPWLLAPFLLVWLWMEFRDYGLEDRCLQIAKFATLTAGVFLVINLPFVVWDFSAWLSSVLFPFTANLVEDGSGLVVITRSGIVDLGKDVYTALSLAVFAVLMVCYIRFYADLKLAVWLFPALVFWFAHRSLSSYFVYWVPLLMLSVFYVWQDQQRPEPAPNDEADEVIPEPALPG